MGIKKFIKRLFCKHVFYKIDIKNANPPHEIYVCRKCSYFYVNK